MYHLIIARPIEVTKLVTYLLIDIDTSSKTLTYCYYCHNSSRETLVISLESFPLQCTLYILLYPHLESQYLELIYRH